MANPPADFQIPADLWAGILASLRQEGFLASSITSPVLDGLWRLIWSDTEEDRIQPASSYATWIITEMGGMGIRIPLPPPDSVACQQARAQLTTLDPRWANATCDEVTGHVCSDPTIFVGSDPIRLALCGVAAPVPPSPAPPGGGGQKPTDSAACVQARNQLARLDSRWSGATCEQIVLHVCSNPTVFVGNDPIRLALCGAAAPVPPPPGGGGGIPGPAPRTTNWLPLLSLGGVGAAVVILSTLSGEAGEMAGIRKARK